MPLFISPAGINATPSCDQTDSKILDLLSRADDAISLDTIKFCIQIRKDTALKRLQKLARWGQVRLVTRRMTSFWKAVEGGE